MFTPGNFELQSDTRPAQALRVADYLEHHQGATAKEIDAACDTGCITKVISDMPQMGYDLRKSWRYELCNHGNKLRQVRTYFLAGRPKLQADLFSTNS